MCNRSNSMLCLCREWNRARNPLSLQRWQATALRHYPSAIPRSCLGSRQRARSAAVVPGLQVQMIERAAGRARRS